MAASRTGGDLRGREPQRVCSDRRGRLADGARRGAGVQPGRAGRPDRAQEARPTVQARRWAASGVGSRHRGGIGPTATRRHTRASERLGRLAFSSGSGSASTESRGSAWAFKLSNSNPTRRSAMPPQRWAISAPLIGGRPSRHVSQYSNHGSQAAVPGTPKMWVTPRNTKRRIELPLL